MNTPFPKFLTGILILAALIRLVPAAEPPPFLDTWLAAQTNIHTWTADAIQTRSIKTFAQPLVSTGKVWVATPNHFRWELGQPPQTIAIRQPDVLYLLYPNLKRAEKYPLGGAQGGPWREVLALLDATFPRNRGDLESHFTFGTTTLSNGIAELVLQPKSSFARKFMTEIRVAIRTNDFTPTSTELRLSDGSTMRNDFSNSIINQPIPDSQFQPLIGPDTRLVEPLKK